MDADDIADVAVAALTDDRHLGQIYELTGPRLWTFAEAIAEIARVTGRDLRFVEISSAEYAALLAGAGVPAEFVTLMHLPLRGGARRAECVGAGRRVASAQSSGARLQ